MLLLIVNLSYSVVMGEYRTVKVQDAKLLSKAIDLPQKLKILEKIKLDNLDVKPTVL